MPKFKSIPHEVTAVQWQGSVTLELRELFGPRPLAVRSDPLRLFRPTLVVPLVGYQPKVMDCIADVGDWVVRTEYDEELGFELDVMEPEDFGASYRPVKDSSPVGLEFNIAIPAILTSASGEAPTDIRVRLAAERPSPYIVASVAAQLLSHLKRADLDPGALLALREAVDRFVPARGPTSPPPTPTVPIDLVTKAALHVGLDLNCKACSLAALGGGHATGDHADNCQTIEAIRVRLG
jgi:hypothetical protein